MNADSTCFSFSAMWSAMKAIAVAAPPLLLLLLARGRLIIIDEAPSAGERALILFKNATTASNSAADGNNSDDDNGPNIFIFAILGVLKCMETLRKKRRGMVTKNVILEAQSDDETYDKKRFWVACQKSTIYIYISYLTVIQCRQ
jgi:hypothetical protein